MGEAKAILLVGNDPTEQNPLVAWQIRTAIRHHGARLYVINVNAIKLRGRPSSSFKLPRAQSRPRCGGSLWARPTWTPAF